MLEIMKFGKWDIDKMITDEYSLENLSEAIERAADVGKERAEAEGWIDADDLERELGVID